MLIFKTKVLNFLAQGMRVEEISQLIGITTERIIEIMREEGFAEELKAKIIEYNAGAVPVEELSLESKYQAAEHSLVRRVMSLAGESEIQHVTAALRVVADRQMQLKKIEAEKAKPGEGEGKGKILVLNMPNIIVNKLDMAKSLEIGRAHV